MTGWRFAVMTIAGVLASMVGIVLAFWFGVVAVEWLSEKIEPFWQSVIVFVFLAGLALYVARKRYQPGEPIGMLVASTAFSWAAATLPFWAPPTKRDMSHDYMIVGLMGLFFGVPCTVFLLYNLYRRIKG